MQILDNGELAAIDGGSDYTACGIAVGATAASFFVSPLFGLYMFSKAFGVCAIELAINHQ